MQSFPCAEFEFEGYHNESRDWQLSLKYATFSHKEACEFIFYIGNKNSLSTLEANGFSKQFLEVCREVKQKGFKYILMYL